MRSDADDTADYFGACPVCGQGGVARSMGRDHWFYCEQHRTKWWGGRDLFSAEQPRTAAEVVANARFLRGFTEVAPMYPKARRDG